MRPAVARARPPTGSAAFASKANHSRPVRPCDRKPTHLASATEQFAQTAGEIGWQVRKAGTLTDDASHAAAAAGKSVDGLKASSAQIGNVWQALGRFPYRL